METLQELLNKLDTFNMVKATRSDDELHFSNGLKATYRVETHKHKHSRMTFQAVLRVTLIEQEGGYMPYSWGCSTEEDNTLLVQWFYGKASIWHSEMSDKSEGFTPKIREMIEG